MSLAKLVSIFVSSGVGSKLKLGVRGGGGLDLSKTWTRKKRSLVMSKMYIVNIGVGTWVGGRA